MNVTFPDLRSAIRSFACGLLAASLFAALHAWAQQPTVAFNFPTDGATLNSSNILLTATAGQPTGYTITKVEFFAGTTLIGTDTTAPYSTTWSSPAVGNYALTAKVTATKKGSPTLTATSAVVNVTVVPPPPPPPPTVTLTAPANNCCDNGFNTILPGSNITVSATASAPAGYTLSKVEFFQGTTLIGTDTSAPYSVIWSNVPQGNYVLTAKATAVKSGSPTVIGTSAPVQIWVTRSPTTTITPLNGTSSPTYPATFRVRVSATDPDGTVSQVQVYWWDGINPENFGVYVRSEPPWDYELPVTITPIIFGPNQPYIDVWLGAIPIDNQGRQGFSNSVNLQVGLVQSAPLGVSSLAPTAVTLAQGSVGTLTATISVAQPTDTQLTVASSQTGIALVPATVTVPAGSVSAVIPVTALSPGVAQVSASVNGVAASSQVTVTAVPPTPVSVVPALASIALGGATSATVTISSVQASDTVVALAASPAGIVDMPATATVTAGQLTAMVPVSGLAYGQAGITASLNGASASAGINVVPPPATVIALEPPQLSVVPGAASQFTVRINAVQTIPSDIQLASSNPAVLQVPASVAVPAGARTVTFSASALSTGDVTVTASVQGSSKSAAVHVAAQNATLVSLVPSPLPLQPGATGSLTVTLNAAQATATTVTLANANPAIVELPASVTIPPGATSAQFSAHALATGTALITASLNASSASATVDVAQTAPVVTTLLPATVSLPKGRPGLLSVTVSRAPRTPTPVTLISSNPAVASVPTQVTIPAGALSAEFPVMANSVGPATITAMLNGALTTSAITVAPAELVVLANAPQAPIRFVGESVSFTATGTMTDGTTQDFTTRATWTSSNPAVATIATTGIASAQGVGQTTIGASFSFAGVQTGEQVTVSTNTVLIVKAPSPLVLTTPTTNLIVGQAATVTVSTSDPAPPGGLTVSLSGGGTGAGTFPSAVIIPAQQTSATFVFTASAAGTFTINAVAPNRLPALLTFTIAPLLRIDSISATSGLIGAVITLTGTGFNTLAGNNQVSFAGVNNTSVFSPVLSATATQISVRVPALAETGRITVTNANGTAQSPVFTVQRDQDFQVIASPSTVSVYQGASNSTQVQLSSVGLKPFTGLVTLSVSGLPAGVTASFSPSTTISGAQSVTLTFAATATATLGNQTVFLRGDFLESGAVLARTSAINLAVQSSAGVTGLKGRFVTPAGVGVAGVIVRADTTQNPQPQTTTDSAGNFQLAGLPAGQITFRFDATPANPLYPIWPYSTTITANQVAVVSDWTINPPPTDEKFVPIANAAQTQVVTDARFPGLEVRLPAGVNIVGYDGVPKSRIAVEKVDLAKLPVTGPPVATGSTYQLYFGTPMGGIPSAPIPVTLPNDTGGEPGESVNIWYFDGSPMGGTGEWKIAGQGIVSVDGKTIRMPDGTGIPRFCGVCGLMCPQLPDNRSKETDKGPQSCPVKAGNPVTLSTGQEMPTTSGLSCSGLTPIATGMSYNPVDAFNNIGGTTGSIGLGWVLDYDIAFLPFDGPQKRLVLPGNNVVNFTDNGSGVYRTSDDPRFDGAEMHATTLSANEWELKFRDGTLWHFRPYPGTPTFLRGGPPTFVFEIIDPQGNSLPIQRQTNGRITAIGTPERGVTMTYGSNGLVSQISDSAGRNTSFTYTTSNRLASVTDPDGRQTSYTYVKDDEFAIPAVCTPQPSFGERLKTITYPGRPIPTENFYGPGRRVLRQTGFDGLEHRFAYRVSGACVTNISNPAVRCTGPSCPDVDSWENFQAGWRIHGGTIVATTVIQPNGKSTTTEFNSRKVATATTDEQGQKTTTKLDAANRVTERSDALGRTWKYQYDLKGNLTQVTDPLGRVTNTTYHPVWNKPTSVTRFDEANQPQTWNFEYDAAKGTLLTATNPLNQATTFAYTPRGQLERITDTLQHATRFEYNPTGDLVKVIDALLNETQFGVDGAGRRIQTVDALDNITRTTYNGIDQLTSVLDAKNQQTTLAYDPAGRLQTVTNARNFAIQSYGYDSGDRLKTRTDAKLRQTLYNYDISGRLESMTDRRGLATTYGYDDQDRLTSVTRGDGVTRFSYDAVGRLGEISDPSGTISYAYDSVDRIIRETQATGGATNIIEYGYDALDRRTSRTVVAVSGEVTSYGYDRANRLTSIDYRGQTTTFGYDAAGRLTLKVLPNGIKQELAYDEADRLQSITYKNPDDTLIEAVSYGYDGAGRRTVETRGTSPLADTTFTASYDEANRMTSITFTGTGKTFALSYDDNGNLTEKRESANPSNVTTYNWDSRNRLTGIAGPSLVATFEYDALDRRISRTVNGDTRRYIYDGPQSLGEIANGAPIGLLTGLELDEVIARYTAQGARVYLTDALNTVLAQARDDRSVLNYYAYSPYGESLPLGSDEGNSIQFTARENDQTGLYYYRARYYDPILKRFIQEDPIGLAGALNVYGYVAGDPVSLNDPEGLQSAYPSCGGESSCERAMRAGGIPPVNPNSPLNNLRFSMSMNVPITAVPIGPIRVPLGVSMACTIGSNWNVSGYIGFGVVAGASLGAIPRTGVTPDSKLTSQAQMGFRSSFTVPVRQIGMSGSYSNFYSSASGFAPVGPPQSTVQFGGGASASLTYGVRWGSSLVP